jgi:hypothetical protein
MRIRYVISAGVAFATVAALAHLHVASQIYHPVVKVSSPDGLVITVVQEAVAERTACGEANGRFLKTLQARCKSCEVVYARCDRQLEGVEYAVLADRQIPYDQVVAGPVRVIVAGPKTSKGETCEHIASGVVKLGVRSATCILPRIDKGKTL